MSRSQKRSTHLSVTESHLVDALRKRERAVHQELGVGAILDGAASHQLPVQAPDGVHVCVKHADQPDEESIEEATLKK